MSGTWIFADMELPNMLDLVSPSTLLSCWPLESQMYVMLFHFQGVMGSLTTSYCNSFSKAYCNTLSGSEISQKYKDYVQGL